jgi:hypothetical protein
MALLGNFIGGALGMQSATDYATAVDSASKLQALQRKNQFTKDMMNSAKPADPAAVRQVAPFNPDDAFGFDNLQQPGLRNIPPVVDNKGPDGQYDGDDLGNVTKPELAPKRNPDGSLVIEPSADGSLAQGDTVKRTDPYNEAANEFSLMPDLGPAVPDISNYNLAAKQAEQAKRNQLKGLLSGVSRRAGMRSGIAGRKMTGEEATATKWWASDEAFQLFYNRPEMLQEAEKIGAIEFAKRYTSQSDERASSIVSRESSTRTRKLIDGRIDGLKTQIGSNKVQRVYRMANDLGIDPFAAIAIFGIESDFGRNSGTSSKGAKGGMQVMPAQFKRLKTWFADPANRAAIESAFTMADGTVNKARVDYAIQTFSNMKMPNARGQGGNGGEIYGGLAQLIYNKAIGLPKNLWGAGYQANANKVLSAGAPLNVDDGNISNSDYNSAYVTLYNHIAATYGKQLSDVEMPYGVDLNTIAGSGVGQLVMAPVTNTAQTDTTGKDTTGKDTTGTNTTATEIVAEANKALDGTTQTVTNADGTKKESIATVEVTEPEQEIVKFLETPPNIGIEMQNLLNGRKLGVDNLNRQLQLLNEQINANNAKAAEYDRFADIALANGQIATFERYSGLADGLIKQSNDLLNSGIEAQNKAKVAIQEFDNKMLLVQGAQALQDLSFGSTARAGAVLSAFSGLDIQVVPRSDGKYDLMVNGNRQQTYTMAELSDKLRRTYSQAYRESQTKLQTERQTYLFEKGVDLEAELTKQRDKLLGDLKLKNLDNAGAAYLEELKQRKGEFKALGDGFALIYDNGQYFLLQPQAVEETINGEKVRRPKLTPLSPGQAQALNAGGATAGDFKAAAK